MRINNFVLLAHENLVGHEREFCSFSLESGVLLVVLMVNNVTLGRDNSSRNVASCYVYELLYVE